MKSSIFMIALILLLCVLSVSIVYGEAYDEQILQKVVARSVGENGFNAEATLLTACTIYNRLERGYGNGEIDGVLKAYHAKDSLYSDEQFNYVKDNLDRCPTNILYAFSYNDILNLGFPLKSADYIVGNNESCNYYGYNKAIRWQCAYFYSKWQNR